MLILSNQDIQQVLTMDVCLRALEDGYKDLIAGEATYRPRLDTWVPCNRADGYYRWGTMEGASRRAGVLAIRMKSDIVYWPEGRTEEKYCIRPGTYCGLIFLLSTENGEPLAFMNDGYLQHMRVGGSAGLGAKYLAKDPAEVVGMLGSGGMARSYLRAFALVRKIRYVKVYSPTKSHRQAYAREMSRELGIRVTAVDGPEAAVEGADIVATCTDSMVPIVDPSWVAPGMHLTNVGAERETNPKLLERCDLVVQLGGWGLPRSAEGEGLQWIGSMPSYVVGDPHKIARMPEHAKVDVSKYPMLADIMSGKVKGRADNRQVTFFWTAGTQGLQFASVAGVAYKLAKARGLGREIPTDWFLQTIRD